LHLALRETSNSTKYLNKNENYNAILEMPFVFNLQIVLMARRYCRFSLGRQQRCWLRTGSRRMGQEGHIRPGDKEEGITADETP
jgi:hypothetical protein